MSVRECIAMKLQYVRCRMDTSVAGVSGQGISTVPCISPHLYALQRQRALSARNNGPSRTLQHALSACVDHEVSRPRRCFMLLLRRRSPLVRVSRKTSPWRREAQLHCGDPSIGMKGQGRRVQRRDPGSLPSVDLQCIAVARVELVWQPSRPRREAEVVHCLSLHEDLDFEKLKASRYIRCR